MGQAMKAFISCTQSSIVSARSAGLVWALLDCVEVSHSGVPQSYVSAEAGRAVGGRSQGGTLALSQAMSARLVVAHAQMRH
jgi:hypothetical protein